MKIFKFSNLFMIFYMILMFTPFFVRNIHPTVIIIFVVIWFFILILSNLKCNSRFTTTHIITVYWIGIIIVQYLRVSNYVQIGNLYLSILYYMPIFFVSDILVNMNIKSISKVFSIFLIIIFITVFTNIYILINDPKSSKYMTGSVITAIEMYKNTNLATITHVSIIAFSFPIILYFFNNSKRIMMRILYFILLISTILFVYLAGSLITLISLLIEIAIVLYYKIGKKLDYRFKLLFVIVMVISLILLYTPIAHFLLYLSTIIDNKFYATRLYDISQVILGNNFASSIGSRLKDILISIRTLFRYPLFGKGLIYHTDVETTGIGMHSQLFDDLARFGLVSIFLLYKIYSNWYKQLKQFINYKSMIYFYSILFGMIFFYLFNYAAHAAYGLFGFLILPLFFKLCSCNENQAY